MRNTLSQTITQHQMANWLKNKNWEITRESTYYLDNDTYVAKKAELVIVLTKSTISIVQVCKFKKKERIPLKYPVELCFSTPFDNFDKWDDFLNNLKNKLSLTI
jgi:hypothetical protein